MATVFVAKSQVIFDPATYDTVSMPLDSTMKIVDMDGTKYLQVVLQGYNSFINVPQVTLGTNQSAKVQIKYTLGPETDSVDMSMVNATVQIMDTLDSVPNLYGAGNVPAYTGIQQNGVTGTFVSLSTGIDKRLPYVNKIQFYGQEKPSYGPTTGDTIWVGKIRASSADPNVIFDPREADTTALGPGMSIVSINDTTYLQVVWLVTVHP